MRLNPRMDVLATRKNALSSAKRREAAALYRVQERTGTDWTVGRAVVPRLNLRLAPHLRRHRARDQLDELGKQSGRICGGRGHGFSAGRGPEGGRTGGRYRTMLDRSGMSPSNRDRQRGSWVSWASHGRGGASFAARQIARPARPALDARQRVERCHARQHDDIHPGSLRLVSDLSVPYRARADGRRKRPRCPARSRKRPRCDCTSSLADIEPRATRQASTWMRCRIRGRRSGSWTARCRTARPNVDGLPDPQISAPHVVTSTASRCGRKVLQREGQR